MQIFDSKVLLWVVKWFLVSFLVVVLQACVSAPPTNRDNICKVFSDKKNWYRHAQKSAEIWRSNIHVPMAIMYQESAFNARAKPPIRFFLGIIPYGRPSTAYGYPQALDSTWAQYQRAGAGKFARRNNFSDAINFIQWYMHQTTLKNKISKTDAYRHYLNYHEGQGGYARGTYQNKAWLLKVAKKVQRRADRYAAQLAQCKK